MTYYQVDPYLSTLSKLEKLELQALHTGHWPSMYGDEIRDFLSDSRKQSNFLMPGFFGRSSVGAEA